MKLWPFYMLCATVMLAAFVAATNGFDTFVGAFASAFFFMRTLTAIASGERV